MHCLHVKNLGASELPPQEFLSRISDLAFVCTRDGSRLRFLNDRATGLLGWTEQEVAGFNPWWWHLFAANAHSQLQQLFVSLDQPVQERPPLDFRVRTAGGSLLPVRIHTLFASPDSILLLAKESLDTGEVEEILRQTQARFRSIVDSLSINLVLKDLAGRRVYANQAYLRLRNLELGDIVGKTDAELFPPDIAKHFSDDDQEVIRTGKILTKFEENVDPDGKRTWTEAIKGPLRDADGHITGVQILFWDATDRKQTELAFERERNLLHALLDNVPDSIYFKDRDSRFVRISRGMAMKFHLKDPDSAIGKTDADIFTEEHAAQARADELRIMETGQPVVALVERETWPDRSDTWCSSTKLPLRDASGEVVGTFGISRDITELIAAEQQLREARDAADSANRAKSEFLANMSHEIRTPMNGVIGMAELLRNTQLNDAQRSFLDMIDLSAHSLLRIINDILDFSKIEAGKLDLETVPFDLRKCVSHAAKSLATRAAQQSVELILELDTDVPDRLMGDPVRLRQVLVNLVGNAIKFTEDGEITVKVSIADGPPAAPQYTLHFAVHDTGIGIPKEKQKKIFEAFSQADVSTTRQYGGTGLGLSISGQLVEMMGGRIWLESEVGIGSTFHFTAGFPIASARADAEPMNESDFQRLDGLPALIVDDNRSGRETLQRALRRRGLNATTVGTAPEALEAYERIFATEPHGVLIVDQGLGKVDGVELIGQLRELAPQVETVTILLSTATHPVSEDLVRANRIDVILQKPALQSEICLAIHRTLNHETIPVGAAPPVQPKAESTGLRFLLAEDGAVNRAVFVGLLEGKGHHVTTAEDGQAAVDAWRDFYFHAILMDVQMPILDGIEATRIIRSEEAEKGGHIPIIAITAAAMESDQQRCLEAGMDDYLSKPVDFAQLDRLLEKLSTGTLTPPTQPEALPINTPPPQVDQPRLINLDAPLSKLKCTAQQQRQLVVTLQTEAKQRLAELSQALDNHDDKLLVRASHSLKSAAALFEAHTVTDIAATIERFARAGETSNARQHFPALRDATTAILSRIHTWLEEQ
ncbi:MAG: PAS domain-containing protein [Pirellulaceae bacterium]